MTKHMAAVIEEWMYSSCRETSAHVPFQIMARKNVSPENAQGRWKEHNSDSYSLHSLAASALPQN